MHGKLDRHSLYPGPYRYGPYARHYRGSDVRIYFGSPFFNSLPYYDHYDRVAPYWHSVPYYVPYAVPVPYIAETEVVVEQGEAILEVARDGLLIPAAEGAADYQLRAEQAFREGDYEEAARLSDHAILEDNRNGKLHLFASQILFALGDYASAAAAIQQAAALLGRGEWGFVVENYQEFYRNEDYVTQMARLDEYIEQNPEAAYARFLRGYHFLYLGHMEAARDDLAKAFELEPRDLLAAELLKTAGGEVPTPSAESRPEAEVIPLPAEEQPER